MQTITHTAPGFPGAAAHWTPSAKDGVGTAYNANSRVWFTLSHGVLNEIYCPHVDSPATRDFEFLITDGASFVHEENSDLEHQIEMPESGALLYRLTNSAPDGRYAKCRELYIAGSGDPRGPSNAKVLSTSGSVPPSRRNSIFPAPRETAVASIA